MKHVFFLAGLFFIASCSGKAETKSSGNGDESLIAAGGQTEQELEESMKDFVVAEEKRLEEERANITTLKFDKEIHDFGDIKPDSQNSCRFKVTNTGSKPLIIEDVKASCGCTTPHKPENPIQPGESDFIEVGFHPNPGQLNEIKKTVTVTANIPGKTAEIKIRAFVK